MSKYQFKIKAIILWERISGKPFALENTEDIYLYLYCVRVTMDANLSQTFDEMLDECDKNPEIMSEFLRDLNAHNKRQKSLEKKN
jgi:hypothetical protein